MGRVAELGSLGLHDHPGESLRNKSESPTPLIDRGTTRAMLCFFSGIRSVAGEFDMAIHPFKIDISTAELEDLQSRLAATRWPEGLRDPGWNDGTSEVCLKELLQHWQHGFDWRAQEQAINWFAQFQTEVHGVGIHFIHERGRGGRPLLDSHPWLSGFVPALPKAHPNADRPRGAWRGCS